MTYSLRYLLGIFICFIVMQSAAQTDNATLAVMTFNIRYANSADGEFSWDHRKEMVFRLIQNESPDIIGMQEVLLSQYDELKTRFPDYESYGLGRDDGKQQGEYCPLFFNRSRFLMLGSGTFWLSKTPEIPGSISWKSACRRIVSWLKLADLKTGDTLLVFNTHFDYKKSFTRVQSAKLLLSKINELASPADLIIITGDFNDYPGSSMHRKLLSDRNKIRINDTRNIALALKGPAFTFGGFPFMPKAFNPIDMIFTNSYPSYKVNSVENLNYNENGKYPSDHLPVIARFSR